MKYSSGVSFVIKIRHSLLILLVIMAIATIIIPIQVEQPSFFFKSIQMDGPVFIKPLFNMRQALSLHRQPLPPANVSVVSQTWGSTKPLNEQTNRMPTAWMLRVMVTSSEITALEKVKQLQAQGFPAFYDQTAAVYFVWIGPDTNLQTIRQWRNQIVTNPSDHAIAPYQPIQGSR